MISQLFSPEKDPTDGDAPTARRSIVAQLYTVTLKAANYNPLPANNSSTSTESPVGYTPIPRPETPFSVIPANIGEQVVEGTIYANPTSNPNSTPEPAAEDPNRPDLEPLMAEVMKAHAAMEAERNVKPTA